MKQDGPYVLDFFLNIPPPLDVIQIVHVSLSIVEAMFFFFELIFY